MQALVDALKAEALSIGTCESLTGGMFASELTSVPGVSAVFKGGFVTYWNTCKIDVVHVSAETIDKYGVVSAPTAIEMAEKAGCCLNAAAVSLLPAMPVLMFWKVNRLA